MKYLWKAYWSARLVGHRVDPAKVIIYRTKRWHFVVHDGTYVFSSAHYDNRRLHLHTNHDSGRIEHVTIG